MTDGGVDEGPSSIRVYYYGALTLLLGGFGFLGVGAGVRVGLAVAIETMDCMAVNCSAVALALGAYVQTFLSAGALLMILGGVALFGLRKRMD